MRILGVETSCDETALCIMDATGEEGDFRFQVLGNALFSQAKIHEQYGGVFPNIAKREHQKNLVPLLEHALREANELRTYPQYQGEALTLEMEKVLERETELLPLFKNFIETYEPPTVDAIAVTIGPGLEPALWVGINFAKALSIAWNIPLIPVNHMEGHIVMSMIELRSQSSGFTEFEYPLLSLLISGGHTELLLSRAWMQYEILGQTRDDAVGEAFDKIARLLDLPYPGGPHISRLASGARKIGHPMSDLKLPRPMMDTDNYDFSFSGLKTAVRRLVEEFKTRRVLNEELKAEVAREFEDACADVLVAKTLRAVVEFDVKTVLVGGGVSANTHIRNELSRKLSTINCQLLIPPPELATDNAIMIALAGYFRALKKEFAEPVIIRANGNLKLN